MDKLFTMVFAIIGIVVVIAGLGLILAFPIKWCWNYTIPMLFGLQTIGWGQAWYLNYLAGALLLNIFLNQCPSATT